MPQNHGENRLGFKSQLLWTALELLELEWLKSVGFTQCHSHPKFEVHDIGWLVVSTPLKNMKVSWDYYSQYMET